MKEDIKNLEEIINLCKEEINNNDKNITATLDLEDLKSLENLLTKYKEIQLTDKEKEVVEAYRNLVKITGATGGWVVCNPKQMWSNYFIPKSKVIEKIEELKGTEELLSDEQGYWGGSDLLEQIKVLQELLEKEK